MMILAKNNQSLSYLLKKTNKQIQHEGRLWRNIILSIQLFGAKSVKEERLSLSQVLTLSQKRATQDYLQYLYKEKNQVYSNSLDKKIKKSLKILIEFLFSILAEIKLKWQIIMKLFYLKEIKLMLINRYKKYKTNHKQQIQTNQIHYK